MAVMKTPGVYIVEKNAFPNSVVEVATAVPAFIGHTERAMNGNLSLLNKPMRITSMSEFRSYFGGECIPVFDIASLAQEKTKEKEEEKKDDKTQDKKEEKTEAASAPDFTFNDVPYSLTGVDKTGYNLYYHLLMFFSNGGGPCYIVSVGDYKTAYKAQAFTDGIDTLNKEQEPTMVIFPEAVSMDQSDFYKVGTHALAHCGKMQNRFAILDVFDGYKDRKASSGDPVNAFRDSIGTNALSYGAAYYPWVNASVISEKDITLANFKATHTEQVKKDDKGQPVKDAQEKEVKEKIASLTMLKTLLLAEAGNIADKTRKEQITAQIDHLENLTAMTDTDKDILHAVLLQNSPLYREIVRIIARKANLLAPSAAMAGIYTLVDNTRGVWKAPANVALNNVVSPAVNITHDDQEDLNVPINGKSVNAIRSFTGEGIKIWGARTLDGNSLDWRYINVRRTLIFLEESIKNAARAYVFEPNDANTWLNMKSMIENFLRGVWKRGGLAGASPDDAYTVMVGLGQTMTPEDILEGILRITVLVAVTRPAEFIEITFQQQMQKS